MDELQASSHFSPTTLVSHIKSGIHWINTKEIPCGYTVFACTSAQRQYTLSSLVSRVHSLRCRGILVEPRAPQEFPTTTATSSQPRYWTVIPYPQDTTSSTGPLGYGNQILVVDPPPSTTGTGTTPTFPATGDWFFSMYYYTRIPTAFTGTSTDSNYIGNYTFQIMDEMMSVIGWQAGIYMALVDGNDVAAKALKEMRDEMLENLKMQYAWDNMKQAQQIRIAGDIGVFDISQRYTGY